MTTIAVKDGVMVSDSMNSYHCMPVVKLHRLSDDSIVGGAGVGGSVRSVREWLENLIDNPDAPAPALADQTDVETLRLYPNGRVTFREGTAPETNVDLPFFAIGSGADYAMGAMAVGADAEQAVSVAIRFDKSTGGPVRVLGIRQ